MGPAANKHFEYPFSKIYVFVSVFLAGLSISFATVVLMGEESVLFSFGDISFMIPALLMYFLFTSILTLVILALKFYLYSMKWKKRGETHPLESEGKASRSLWRSVLIPLLILTIAALFSPLILLALLRPLWWFISISGFIAGVNVPEIILYVYSRRGVK